MQEVREIYKEILMRQAIAVDFHEQMANLFDFLNLRKWKRWHEYQALSEFSEKRGVSRYYENRHRRIAPRVYAVDSNYIPKDIELKDRFAVTDADRKKATREAFVAWCSWEEATKDFLQKQFARLGRLEKTADQNKINELIKAVDQELKELEREYISVMSDEQWHTVIEPSFQDKGHDMYAEKTKNIGIYIC